MKRAAPLLAILLAAGTAHATRIAVGSASADAGAAASVPLTFASEGAAVSTVQVDLLFAAPLSYTGATLGFAAQAAGKELTAAAIAGGVRLTISGNTASLVPDGVVATVSFAVGSGAAAGSYPVLAANPLAADTSGLPLAMTASSGAVTVGPVVSTWFLPSSAHSAGAGTFWTTDLVVANTGTANGTYTLKFLGHDADGRSGAEATFAIPAGVTTVVGDVLGSQFHVTDGWGAIRITATVPALAISGQTSTPGASGGTFGQSVPAVPSGALIAQGAPRSIVGVREDGSFRTNLVIANAGQAGCDVDVTLVRGDGASLGTKRYNVQPLGTRQISYVVREFVASGNVSGARLVIAPATTGSAVAAYAALIDAVTGDPRTLLPQ